MAKASDKGNLSDLEKSVIKVAGDSSKKWYINEFLQILVQNGVKTFGNDSRNLANFLRRRPHLFDFQDDKLSNKVDSEDIRKLRAQHNEEIQRLNQVIKDLKNDNAKLSSENGKLSHAIEDYKDVQEQNDKVIKKLKEELLKLTRKIGDLKCKPKE